MRKKILPCFAVMFAIFAVLATPIYAKAAEKEMNINLTNDYSQASFYFDFQKEQSYEITITDPYGNETTNNVEGDTGVVTITGITAGNYAIKILADEEINVSARVECQNSEATTDTQEINVSSTVSGLKMWFENGVFFASWDENKLGTINIQVTNPTTMQKLHSTSTSDNHYSLEIDRNTKNIEFFIVPASSSRIEGAGSRYTVKVVREVDGEVNYPDIDVLGGSIYSYFVKVGDNITVKVKENGEYVYENTYENGGTYDIEIPLNNIDNEIVTEFYDTNGNMQSHETLVKKDIVAPKFTMREVQEITTEEIVVIAGRVTEVNSVIINDIEVPTDEVGNFSLEYKVLVGDTPIQISAKDSAGNVATVEYLITRNQNNLVPLYILLLVVVAVVLFFIFKRRKGTVQPEHIRNGTTSAQNHTPYDMTEPEPPTPAAGNITKNTPGNVPIVKPMVQAAASNPTVKEIKTPLTNKKIVSKEEIDVKSSPKKPKREVHDIMKRKKVMELASFAIVFVVLLGCIMYFLTNMIKITEVASDSMEPALKTGTYAIYNQLAYEKKDIQRGDIICFESIENKKVFAKRVIGIPGDNISFADGYLLINGEKVEEMYITDEDLETNSAKSFTVPEKCVFVLGDNREISYDSRYWENPYVEFKDIYGKYIGTITFPF